MTIKLRNEDEVARMRVAGRLAAECARDDRRARPTRGHHRRARPHLPPSSSSRSSMRSLPHSTTAMRRQPPFPKSICTSVNHVVCHGIPSVSKRLKSGDVVNIDVTVIKDRYHGDTSKMFFVGEASVMARRSSRSRRNVSIAASSRTTRRASRRHRPCDSVARRGQQFVVVREFCGHGIGDMFHDDPQVLHYGRPDTGMKLEAGMTFTIEPMIKPDKATSSCCPINGPSSRRITSCRRNGSTRSW